MKYLRICLLQKGSHQPVYIEVPIPPELAAAIKAFPVRRAEFLIYDKMQVTAPDLSKLKKPSAASLAEISDFKLL